MTMDTLHVTRLRARYRIPGGDPAVRARLDAALREMLDGALETALARAGVRAHDEVCIRHVDATARLRLGASDPAPAAAWSAALAGAIRQTLDAGGEGVVRYGSRAQALADLLASVARGRLGRAWAWRQLGLWDAGDSPSAATAADEAARALIANPELAVAALAAAGRTGALLPLATRIRAETWAGIARAALGAAGVPSYTLARLLPGAATELEIRAARMAQPRRTLASPDREIPVDGDAADVSDPFSFDRFDHKSEDAGIVRMAERVARASALYPAAVAAEGDARIALAALAIAGIDPAALLHPAAAARVAAVAAQAAEDAGVRIASSASPASPASPASTETAREPDAAPSPLDARRPVRRPPDPSTDAAEDGRTLDDGEAERAPSTETALGAAADRPAAVYFVDKVAEDTAEEWPVGLRATGDTRWGGLLFLLHLCAQIGVPEEAIEAPALAARPLRWTMHRLALTLLALDETDPAALAFAGLGPDAEPPTFGEPAAREEEIEAVEGFAARVRAALHERLRGEPAPDARAAAALVREVCRRQATVEADPGWIDVRLALDEVDTAVRRAGLDLDPGWVPWLGVVVRFVYE
jgi:hypothetical protein